jgi:hypothetical protein
MSMREIRDIPDENKRIVEELTKLHIFKLVWDKDRKWEFLYRGIKISAPIADESFFKLIDKGEHFAKGDSLEVDLHITQIFDNSVNTFINESYLIKKVRKHIRRAEQGSLNF